MLTEKRGHARAPRNLRRERRLWDQPDHKQLPLGCHGCREYRTCGGLHIKEPGFFDCGSFCCRDRDRCKLVCRHNRHYAFRVREIGGYELDNVPRARALVSPPLPPIVHVMYNAAGLRRRLAVPAICLSLYRMFDRDGRPRFTNPEALRDAYRLDSSTRVILTGTDKDGPLERYWNIGTSARIALIRALQASGIELVTTPNFTLHANLPRWQDLHAMKRIALTHEEFLREGLPAALHVNGRTESDFRRWTEYIGSREEVTELSFEFTTIRRERRPQYAMWLAELAASVGRPLRLFVRGGTEVVPALTQAFEVVFLDTNAFMKTSKRQRAVLNSKGGVQWRQSTTLYGEPLDELLEENIAHRTAWMTAILAGNAHSSVSRH